MQIYTGGGLVYFSVDSTWSSKRSLYNYLSDRAHPVKNSIFKEPDVTIAEVSHLSIEMIKMGLKKGFSRSRLFDAELRLFPAQKFVAFDMDANSFNWYPETEVKLYVEIDPWGRLNISERCAERAHDSCERTCSQITKKQEATKRWSVASSYRVSSFLSWLWLGCFTHRSTWIIIWIETILSERETMLSESNKNWKTYTNFPIICREHFPWKFYRKQYHKGADLVAYELASSWLSPE